MMIAQFSTRYHSDVGRRLSKKGPAQKLSLGGGFWKLTGVVIILATLIGLGGSWWFSWSIRRGLETLNRAMDEKLSLQVENTRLGAKRDELVREYIKTFAATKFGLYPTTEKSAGGGATVRIPE